MTLRFYFRNEDGDIEELTDAVDVTTFELSEYAEEGSVAMSTVTLDDPDSSIVIGGHRLFYVVEDEIEYGETRIFCGYTADRTYQRGIYELGRQIRLTVTDGNIVWGRRVMVGADCKRPAETDVARMQWLLTTAESGLIGDDTYLSTGSPVEMDAADYRGQMMQSVADDCAQASGKNWGVTHLFDTGDGFAIWYGNDGLTTYVSGMRLSNVAADIDDLTTFAISEDTTLTRDPSRVYSGVYLPYDGGAVYRQDPDTAAAFAKRDSTMPSLNVKSRTKASARAYRYLADLNTEDDRIETTIYVRADQVNAIRPFHRVQFRASHLPSYDAGYTWCRVLRRTVAYWVPGWYKVTMTLVPGAPLAGPLECGAGTISMWAEGDCVTDRFGSLLCPEFHFNEPAKGNDGDITTIVGVANQAHWPTEVINWLFFFVLDLGANYTVDEMQWFVTYDSSRMSPEKIAILSGWVDGATVDDMYEFVAPDVTLDQINPIDSFWQHPGTNLTTRARFDPPATYRYWLMGFFVSLAPGPQSWGGFTFSEWCAHGEPA